MNPRTGIPVADDVRRRILFPVLLLFLVLSLTSTLRADSPVVFNEIMYHPATNEAQLEWVELQNQLSIDVDLSRWSLDGGIHYLFAEGTIIPSGAYLVIALSPATLSAATGKTNFLGPFTDRLANSGEKLQLRNNNQRIMDELTYGADGDWPVAPDGAGPSLARLHSNLNGADPQSWAASAQPGGTPGTENFPVKQPTVLSNTVVAIEGAWKFNDAGSDLGTGWRSAGYNDSAWPSGSALFFQEEAPLPGAKNTPLAPGRITYYFRTQFNVTGDVSRIQLRLRPVVDDGAVGYLNGVEIFRFNMPSGDVTFSTLASGLVGDAVIGDTIFIPSDQLLAGNNVLAVEVHQGPTFAAYPQAIITSGPVGYWRLPEASGPALDYASAAGPPQLGAQNGTYAGFLQSNLGQPGPRLTDSVSGQPLTGFEGDNNGPRFAGNADGGNDVVTIPDSGIFNFSSTRIFTLEAWVNGPAGQEGGAAIIAKGTGGGGEQFAIDIPGGNYRFFCWNGGTPNSAVVVSASVGPNGTWQHVVAVMDQPAGRMKIYVNGLEVGSAAPPATLINSSHEVSIGARKNSGSSNYDLNFDGRIDEVAIYNRALSPAEITAHFNAAFSSNAAAGADTNDVVFGMEIVTAETLPDPEVPQIAFNELASSTNSAFWVELINYGRGSVDLNGWSIARFGGATNREYTLAGPVLAPGELLAVTKGELGFGADSGDRLILYMPGHSNVADAVIAKTAPRGRSPDATGDWWFPTTSTPGASNSFTFHDELVINEIMFHQRELPAQPALFSATNLLLTISNQWRYHAQGLDLGSAWRLPGYDDSAWRASNAVFFAPTNPFVLLAPKNTFVPLTNSSGDRIVTFYFRTQFQFNGSTNGLAVALRPIIDDGAVFYLNGVEVYRLNMPTTNISYGTLATVNVGIPVFSPQVVLPAGILTPGLNTLAVEVHQFATNSSDIIFGTELRTWNQLSPALPFRDSPESWIEIFNRSTHAVDLTGWRLDNGIDYHFPPGKTLAAGSYLVVAKDAGYMHSLYPALDIVGPFTNRLSLSSDQIALKDPGNNLADLVHYYNGGRWPENADGGGSSLELRDPRADNSKAEAWAASDESGKSQWQTFTWRGNSAPGQTGEPTLWHEFALCLLDGAGEVLLDDLSVIETPSTAPKQLLYNGAFSDGTSAHWRLLGNHRASRVELEPGNPGNYVLHLVASGPGEYQGNQIETTLTNNVAIVDGREYEISFRAKWLAGKRKLNARLYFNRLARTFDLPVPSRSGTPGAANSRLQSNIGPTFSDFSHAPAIPGPNLPVRVSATVADPDGVAGLSIKYSAAGGPWQSVPMTLRSSTPDGLNFSGNIPGLAAATTVQFYVEAEDSLGAVSYYPARGTNSRALYVVQDNQAAASPLHNFRIVMTPAEAAFLHGMTNALSNEFLGCTVIYDESEVFYDIGVRLKGSFVGRYVPRVGFHLQFDPDHAFQGIHEVVSVDRSQHTLVGGVGEIVAKHVANHAGGIPDMQDDLARVIAPLSSYTSMSQLRFSGFDSDFLDAQFKDGSDGFMYEVEVLRWNTTTLDGNPESLKVDANVGGNGYANLELQNYGDSPESYRWFFLESNHRTDDNLASAMNVAKMFSTTGSSLDAQSAQLLDVDEWLRTMAYQELVGTADAYYTGANIHNFRVYTRPEDQKMLYMPWDWDSAYLASTSASIYGTGNIANLLSNQNNRRAYLNHMFDIINSTFNNTYMSRWISHYGTVGSQDMSGILNYITARSAFCLAQLPTAAALIITNNGGNNFSTTNSTITISGIAPIGVKTIEVNGTAYPITWTSLTNWTINVPLFGGVNNIQVQGVDNAGNRTFATLDTITVTNGGPSAFLPVVINEWMADNAGPSGYADPADGLFQDWFELFNPNTNDVNISGYYLTDTLSQPNKWRIPTNTTIQASGFLLVWADNQTNQNSGLPGSDLHAAFQLNAGGEAIGLFGTDGLTPQSTVVFGQQFQNVSQGLFPDGNTNTIYSMTNFTPHAANTLAGPLQVMEVAFQQGTVAISWSSVPGHHYSLQYKDDLSAPAWFPVGQDILASGPTAAGSDTFLPNGHRFYRVIRID